MTMSLDFPLLVFTKVIAESIKSIKSKMAL